MQYSFQIQLGTRKALFKFFMGRKENIKQKLFSSEKKLTKRQFIWMSRQGWSVKWKENGGPVNSFWGSASE